MILIALLLSCIYDGSDLEASYCRGVCAANEMSAADDPEYTAVFERDSFGVFKRGTVSCLCTTDDRNEARYIKVNLGATKSKQITSEEEEESNQ